MNPKLDFPPNFAFLQEHDVQLERLGMLAEKYFAEDPITCLLKTRQFAELLARHVTAQVGDVEKEGKSNE
jgi:type I restriction enzyme, R subunit